MNKTVKIIGIIMLVFVMLAGIAGYLVYSNVKKQLDKNDLAKSNADYIMDNLDKEEIIKDFSKKNFPQQEQVLAFVNEMKQNCDWQNRNGKYVDFYSMKNIGENDQMAYIYEYYLKCDSLRFILTYDMNEDKPELLKFNYEPLELENKMIIYPEKQLKNR